MSRVVTNDDIRKYERMVDYWIKKSVIKNWNGASLRESTSEMSLGNTGMTIADFRQYLLCEVVVALQKYNPDKGTKESTFVHGHLSNRIGSCMKRLTKKSLGYGIFMSNIQDVLHENSEYAGD